MYKFVILSALVAVCAAQIPADTPEVAQAKAAHFAAVQQAQARSSGSQWSAPAPTWNAAPNWNAAPTWNAPASPSWRAWDGVPAPIVVANGHIQDTAEVAAEKSKHFALVNDAAARAASSNGPNDDGQYRHDVSGEYAPAAVRWNAPAPTQWAAPAPTWNAAPSWNTAPAPVWASQPVVVANGHVQDTPEVAALKAERLAALRAAGGF